ncbi:MAG: YihA family ribosome biogenesis GTP-binding protein [Buchnera aphidicola (Pentalonia nigronervosa)]|uniref:Probable GTP-binding protein EngB n=1 Tax=Buchnera aphidicola (Pentalonia nigronervosa) TaxID=1309793 RepID=A0A7H1AYS3_9GAMM|nr:MAG: YihA family ribosome biogenesis GTP-binding protein [Buchnera aphidicola (Pentalonia nigronervosa)]
MRSLNYQKTYFFNSYSRISDMPLKSSIEIAFAGYSNSGKSSAINVLTNQKKLARASKTPGRTQLINFFEVVSGFRIVDLPGYGYAKAALEMKNKWQKTVYFYLSQRKFLKGLVLLMDIRCPIKILDEKIINMMIKNNIPILILLTKCDKVTFTYQQIQLRKVYEKLKTSLYFFKIELFSSTKKIGVKQLMLQINNWYFFNYITDFK